MWTGRSIPQRASTTRKRVITTRMTQCCRVFEKDIIWQFAYFSENTLRGLQSWSEHQFSMSDCKNLILILDSIKHRLTCMTWRTISTSNASIVQYRTRRVIWAGTGLAFLRGSFSVFVSAVIIALLA